ncbi:hypothetical protein AB0C59_10040 [Streptomyces sp. NPDC048664]|uniref:DUF7196 family protein n=1 Tax=Streptomyces sp. NPDC048664 TaxID=3154505 RepID=UPI0034201B77
MGCNCGGHVHPPAGRTITVFRLTRSDGTEQDYLTSQEADAANRRSGNGGTITIFTRPA